MGFHGVTLHVHWALPHPKLTKDKTKDKTEVLLAVGYFCNIL